MAKLYPIQTSFAAGEVSPRIWGRKESPGYQQGLKECVNAIVDTRGPVARRSGVEHRQSIAGLDARIIEFTHSDLKSYLILLTDNLLTVNSATPEFLGPELISNSDYVLGLSGWQDGSIGLGAVSTGESLVNLTPGTLVADEAVISQTFLVPETGFNYRLIVEGLFGSGTKVEVGTTGPGSFDTYTSSLSENSTFHSTSISGAGSTSPLTVTITADGATSLSRINRLSFKVEYTTEAVFTVATPFEDAELSKIQTVMTPDGSGLIIVHNNHPPQRLDYTPSPVAWAFGPITFTSTPAEWIVGNYPNTVTFFEGRSWWSGFPSNQETFYASKSAPDIYDLTLGAGTNATDAIKQSITEQGLIVWMIGSKNLLVGTVLKEFIITSVDGTITPSDIRIEQQSAYGSSPIKPELLGNEVLFVSSDRRKLRSMWYQWTENGYLARDVTYTNDHITEAGIRLMTFVTNPDQYIIICMNDGSIVICTYHRDANDKPVYGWSRHQYNGIVLDVSHTETDGISSLWLALRLTVEGVETIQLVKQSLVVNNSTVYLDVWKEYQLDGVTKTITGLDHLNGYMVIPYVDLAVQTGKLVVGGQITLDEPGFHCYVGITYRTLIKTLPLYASFQTGSIEAYEKVRNKIEIHLYRSGKPIINGVRPPDRTPATLMDSGEQDITERICHVNLDNSIDAEVLIEQDIPASMTLIDIYGEVDVNSL